ncbi:MAG: hypothetical protein RPU34_02210 [Candidatus Sedimenticola sp. (ex Thyasira tokunagai)]
MMNINSKLVATMVLGVLVALAALLASRHWVRSSAEGFRVFARADFCTALNHPTTLIDDQPYCVFNAHLEKTPFSSEYRLWISDEDGVNVRAFSLPEHQVISIEETDITLGEKQ